jgi:hypothetical protein
MSSSWKEEMKSCVLLAEDSFSHACVLEGCMKNSGFSVLGPYPSMRNTLDMLKWAKVDVVVFNASLAEPNAAETLATFLDDSEIPSIMVNWSPLPTTSPLRFSRQELLWPMSEEELTQAVRGLLDRDQGPV